jgi:hypothetical protein
MPSIAHDGPIELLRHNPMLAVDLLRACGLTVRARTADLVANDLTSVRTAEFRADGVVKVILDGPGPGPGGRLVVVAESQTTPDRDKKWSWPAYVALARAQHHCDAVLLVFCPDRVLGDWARQPIPTGHPGFDLVPVVVDAVSTPLPDPGGRQPELAVLGALTGAIDLETDTGRRLVLDCVAAARLEADRLKTYTHIIRAAAPSEAARQALEALMAITYKDEWIDRIEARGEAKGRAEGRAEGLAQGQADMLLGILAARGFQVPATIRGRILACADLGQLQAWANRAVTATSLDEVIQDSPAQRGP